ncbi:MAG: aldolase [Rhodospirillaceae bacterium]|nr:MAG: aldolase [Rhodospirillaceae bacterium]
MNRIHATCVAFEGQAILLQGASESGKSDLALRLMDQGWHLVADDYTELTLEEDGQLYASPPDTLKGLIEIRGIGLIRVPYKTHVPVIAIFDLQDLNKIERLPKPAHLSLEGLRVPLYTLHGLDASAPAKIRLTLKAQAEHLFYNLEAEDA